MAITYRFCPTTEEHIHNNLINVLIALNIVDKTQDLMKGPIIRIPGCYGSFTITNPAEIEDADQ